MSYHCQWHLSVNARDCFVVLLLFLSRTMTMTILDDAIALDNVAKFLQWIAEKWHKQRDETGSQLQVRYHPSPLICQHLSNNDQYHALDTAHKALNGEQAETVIFAPPLTRQSPSQWDATASVTQIVENVWVRDGDTRRWLYSEIMKMRRHELCVTWFVHWFSLTRKKRAWLPDFHCGQFSDTWTLTISMDYKVELG